ncbi:hypothetical protein BDY24DRAFT_103362 [Mrakia frigida]|uniref:uncharacterized protein n=1 Tax=Mrakia frigida TaxID=29902 RepID=UPI003FCC0C4E
MISSTYLSPSPSYLPYLPTELKALILHFSDSQTLARAARSSLAFLHLSSPLLYQDVVVEGAEQLHRLFCSRRPFPSQPKRITCSPRLEAYLALSQINTLTFIPDEGPQVQALPGRFDRLAEKQEVERRKTSSPTELGLAVDVFTIAIRPGSSSRPLAHLYTFVNPLEFKLEVLGGIWGDIDMETCSFPPVFLEMAPTSWTRLDSLVFKNVHPEDHLSCSGWQQGEVKRPYTVTYDLTESVGDGMFEVSRFGLVRSRPW